MVHRIETVGTVEPDGSLIIDRALDVTPGRHHLVLLIDDTPAEHLPLDWPSFVKTTYGSLADIPIIREPGEQYERRERIE
ncbi:MAG TPA: hypothetical protein VHB98_18360 [Chloroflexota bacterium]|jgi:hypothetical protein|nr:hypothetical protein [Chloroflexota bacterium]